MKLPDLDCFIDVKGSAQPGDNIYVNDPGKDDWAFLLIAARKHPQRDRLAMGEQCEKAEVSPQSAAQARRASPVVAPAGPAGRRAHQRALAARDCRIAIRPG
jgi:hypothetical protein